MDKIEQIINLSEKMTNLNRNQKIKNMKIPQSLKKRLVNDLKIETLGQLLDIDYSVLKSLLSESELHCLKINSFIFEYVFKGEYKVEYKNLGINEQIAFIPIGLVLPLKIKVILAKKYIFTLGDLLTTDYETILRIKELDEIQIKKLKECIHTLGFSLKNEQPLNEIRLLLKKNGKKLIEEIYGAKIYIPLYNLGVYTIEELFESGIDITNLEKPKQYVKKSS